MAETVQDAIARARRVFSGDQPEAEGSPHWQWP